MKSKSWENVKDWYDHLVGEGHYYHKNVIIPHVLEKINALKPKALLDVACGQGVLSRMIDKGIQYCGVDLSQSLIESAKSRNQIKNHKFFTGDARDLPPLPINEFDLATFILAIQDIDDITSVFKSIYKKLKVGGELIIVMNHPCFRIPRQSGWNKDEQKKIQSRTLNAYLSTLNIPIQTNPGKALGEQSQTIHHHRPLNAYFKALKESGFIVSNLEELVSDKMSTGVHKKMEDRARKEFPLFLCLTAQKI